MGTADLFVVPVTLRNIPMTHSQAVDRTTRRGLLASALATGVAIAGPPGRQSMAGSAADRAMIAITLDLEMSRHYPTRDQTHWDYEKGNLDAPTKAYATQAARRVKAKGGVIHFFALGQTMEQADVGWLKDIVEQGHPVGNHTYDHVNVKATRSEDIQFRFRRCPWLIEGKAPAEVIGANIRLGSAALKERIGVPPAGFRTPGGFNNGLDDRPDVQLMLQQMGYSWVSSKYPAHPLGNVGQGPDRATTAAVIAAQAQAQPYFYPSGLIELPMNPVSDVTAMRSGRWPLEAFLEVVRAGVSWAIDRRAVFSFLAHPSCLVVADPAFQAIEMICDLVRTAGDRAMLADLNTIARATIRAR